MSERHTAQATTAGTNSRKSPPLRTEPEDQLATFTPYLMNRIIAGYNKGVEEALTDVGVSVAQMRTLAVLAKGGPCTISELSVQTVINQSTLSRRLDALEAAGLIRRETESGDNRVRKIHLTEEGQAGHDVAWPEMLSMEERMLAALTDAEKSLLNALLLKVLCDSGAAKT